MIYGGTIMNRTNIDPTTYDLDFLKLGGRYMCMNCGVIFVDELDFNTPYLDLHCKKCGSPVTREYPEGFDEQNKY